MAIRYSSVTIVLLDLAAADHVGDQLAMVVVVRADEAAIAHVGDLALMLAMPLRPATGN